MCELLAPKVAKGWSRRSCDAVFWGWRTSPSQLRGKQTNSMFSFKDGRRGPKQISYKDFWGEIASTFNNTDFTGVVSTQVGEYPQSGKNEICSEELLWIEMSQKLVLHWSLCGEFSIHIPGVFFLTRNQRKLWMLKDKVAGTPNVHLKNFVPESYAWKKSDGKRIGKPCWILWGSSWSNYFA